MYESAADGIVDGSAVGIEVGIQEEKDVGIMEGPEGAADDGVNVVGMYEGATVGSGSAVGRVDAV